MLHTGKLNGWPHQLVMLLICLMVLASSVSGLWIWWSRRPRGRLAAPPLPAKLPPMRGAIAVLVLFCLSLVYDLNMARRLDKTMNNAIDVAVNVFLNFANIFIRLLSIMGQRK